VLFTAFTPLYNSRNLIHRVWESLQAQTFRDFEWLIVDDGSPDACADLLAQYQAKADFPIRIYRQENGGKHTAWNMGVELAHGELFLSCDHDDAFVPTTMERFRYWWHTIPESERGEYSGVNVQAMDPETRQIIGTLYPRSPMISNNLELDYIYHMTGEKWGVLSTAALRNAPFPRDPELKRSYLSECCVWYQLARKYKVLCVNEPLRFFYRDSPISVTTLQEAGGLTNRLTSHLPARYYFKNWNLNTNLDYLRRSPKALMKTALDVWISGLSYKRSPLKVLNDGRRWAPWLVRLAALPAGALAFAYVQASVRWRKANLRRKKSPARREAS
jgi:glycosyltransferase involved in cell wall biosynthesis